MDLSQKKLVNQYNKNEKIFDSLLSLFPPDKIQNVKREFKPTGRNYIQFSFEYLVTYETGITIKINSDFGDNKVAMFQMFLYQYTTFIKYQQDLDTEERLTKKLINKLFK